MISVKSKITTNVTIELDESEARALNAIASYDTESFLKFFYQSMGRDALRPNEHGLISLFKSIKVKLPMELKRVDDARNLVG